MSYAHDLIVSLRCGHPEACDFCKKPYDDDRRPEPEEAGEWACTECVARWHKEYAVEFNNSK